MLKKLFEKIKARCGALYRIRKGLVNSRYDYIVLQRASGKKIPSRQQMRFITRVLTPAQKIWFRSSIIVFTISGLLLAGGIVAQFRESVPKIGGEYVEGIVGNPRFVNPLFSSANETDAGLTKLVYSGLFKYNGKQEIVPDLAKEYSVSADRKTYTVELLPDLKWHNEEPLTARDVAFTVQLLKNPVLGSPLAGVFAETAAEAISTSTVRFTLAEPNSAFLPALTVGILPEHIWSAIPADQIRFAELNLKPVGSGPFMFKRLIKEENGFVSRYELTRFPNYHRKPAFIQDLAFQFYSEYEGAAGALEGLRTQKVSGLNFMPTAFKEKVSVKSAKFVTLQLPQYTALFFNLNDSNSIVSDKNLRQAMADSITKSKILQDTLRGEGTILGGPIVPGFPGYANAEASAANTDLANDLLDKKWTRIPAEEYRKDFIDRYVREHLSNINTSTNSGISTSTIMTAAAAEADAYLPSAQLFYRADKNKKIAVVRLVTADTPEYQKVSSLIAGYWQDIGIKTEIIRVNQKDIGRSVLKNRDYDVLLYGVIVGNDPDQFPFWHSSQVAHPGLNLSGYTNRKVDDILLKIRGTEDVVQQAALYTEFQKLLNADIPALFLYSPSYTYVLGDSIRGFAVERIGHPADRFANINEWYIKTGTRWKQD